MKRNETNPIKEYIRCVDGEIVHIKDIDALVLLHLVSPHDGWCLIFLCGIKNDELKGKTFYAFDEIKSSVIYYDNTRKRYRWNRAITQLRATKVLADYAHIEKISFTDLYLLDRVFVETYDYGEEDYSGVDGLREAELHWFDSMNDIREAKVELELSAAEIHPEISPYTKFIKEDNI